ncbi:MAG TPA: UbiA family prenyltransferase [Candidatus Limnocylindrales bacterium]
MALVAFVAGAEASVAIALGASMTLLQFAIGTLNDLVDAPRDAGRRRGKPIPDGLVTEGAARVVLVVCAAGGLALALLIEPALVVVALLGLGVGVWYDLHAKGTRLSWLPIALGVPLLPVFGWYGATGTLPAAFAVLVPAAALAGAALAIANASADCERDAAAGVVSLAVSYGQVVATGLVLALQAAVAVLAVASCARLGGSGMWLNAVIGTSLVPVLGALLGFVFARRGPGFREFAFEVQAVGLGLLAVAWVNALSVVPGAAP